MKPDSRDRRVGYSVSALKSLLPLEDPASPAYPSPMSESSDLKTVHLADYQPIAKDVLEALPLSLVRQKMIVPVAMQGGRLTAAVPKADGIVKPQGLHMVAHCPVDLVLAPLDEIIAFIKKHYGDEAAADPLSATVKSQTFPEPYQKLLEDCLSNKASELLLESSGEHVRIRQRIRGVLITDLQTHLTPEQAQKFFSIVRQNAPPAQKQETWASWNFAMSSRHDAVECFAVLSETSNFHLLTVHFRVFEEKMFSPASWGMGPHQARALENLLQKRQGVILFCGTESDDFRSNLRACAKELATAERHVLSVSSSGSAWLPGVEHSFGRPNAAPSI